MKYQIVSNVNKRGEKVYDIVRVFTSIFSEYLQSRVVVKGIKDLPAAEVALANCIAIGEVVKEVELKE